MQCSSVCVEHCKALTAGLPAFAQVSIFMTHVTNYANDRLAPYLFQHLFKFVTRWTKLELLSGRPLTLGQTYFSLFPEDKEPVWTVSGCGQSSSSTRSPSPTLCSLLVVTKDTERFGPLARTAAACPQHWCWVPRRLAVLHCICS